MSGEKKLIFEIQNFYIWKIMHQLQIYPEDNGAVCIFSVHGLHISENFKRMCTYKAFIINKMYSMQM